MLTGRLPFNGATPQELAQMHRSVQPELPRKYNPNIPTVVEQIILKVLSKEPAARYRTADQLGRVLASVMQQPLQRPAPATSKPPTPISPPISRPNTSTSIYQPIQTAQSNQTPRPAPYIRTATAKKEPIEFDWLTWVLALIAFIIGGGLIPFWLWVMVTLQRLSPPN
jgi:serine/threonine-protein kinase